jgi:hypothetical protein
MKEVTGSILHPEANISEGLRDHEDEGNAN